MVYLDKNGNRISASAWLKLQSDEKYKVCREFDNGKVRLRLVWIGKINRQAAQSFRDTWPVFSLGVWNYRADGTLVPDPLDNDITFPTLEDGVDRYEEFLLNWSDCQIDDDGKFVEVDNSLAPPPPPDPDKPSDVEIKGLSDSFGAW